MKKKFDNLKYTYGDNEELRQTFCVDTANLVISYKKGTSEVQVKKKQNEKLNELRKLQEETNISLEELCDICLEKYNILDPKNAFLDCGCVIHLNCFQEYLETLISNRTITILCPNSICKTPINPKIIRKSIESNQNLLTKYEKWDLEDYASKNFQDISCCPSPDCNYMYFYIHNNDTKFSCPICYEDYCLKCQVNYHDGETCNEYYFRTHRKQIENENQYKFFDTIHRFNYKKCPTCRYFVEKTEVSIIN